jgi:phosphotransferase system  glucose/maltose/N-acetylglucosamine-specific IIC component
MDQGLLRVVICGVFALLLFMQSVAAAKYPIRQRAFQVSALGLVILAVYNGLLMAGMNDIVLLIVGGLTIAVILYAVLLFVRSFQKKEIGDKREQVAAAAEEFRKRRENKQ